MHRLFKAGFVVTSALILAHLGSSTLRADDPPSSEALREIPGLTAPDPFPHGCVDCHVNRPDLGMDVRLSTLMKTWQSEVSDPLLTRARAFSPTGMMLEGKHPELEEEVAHLSIPDACLECHSLDSDSAPPFAQLLHGLHLVGGQSNHFVSMFQGECTHCHKLDAATGLWTMATGRES